MFRPFARVAMLAALTLGLLGLAVVPASAVTYGTVVARPSVSAPWSVTVYHSSTATGVPIFICGGSALSAREVITSAQCVEGPGFYYVEVGADKLAAGRLIPIEAINDHAGFSLKAKVNDIAVIRPLYPLALPSYARLATPAMTAAIRGPRPPALVLYGWGNNQLGKLTGTMSTSALVPQTRLAQAKFGAGFRPALMIAAGRVVKGGAIAGACKGDGGSPLVTLVKGVPYVAGVASFGEAGGEGCTAKSPSVFTAVSAYSAWVATARKGLAARAASNNRALPVLEAPVAVSGTVALGSVLTCTQGTWSSNATSIATTWARIGSYGSATAIGTGATYTLVAADAGSDISCIVSATSAAGVATASARVTAVAAPSSYSRPVITGVASYATPGEVLNAVVTCTAPAYTQPIASSTTSWFVEVNAVRTPLVDGPTVTLTDPVLHSLAGNKLVCVTTNSNAMGSHVAEEYVSFGALKPPSIYGTVAYAGTSSTPQAGAVATCNLTGAEGATVTYRWGIEPTYPLSSQPSLSAGVTVLGTGASYTLTAADVAAIHGKYLACEATATTWQGSGVAVSSKYFS